MGAVCGIWPAVCDCLLKRRQPYSGASGAPRTCQMAMPRGAGASTAHSAVLCCAAEGVLCSSGARHGVAIAAPWCQWTRIMLRASPYARLILSLDFSLIWVGARTGADRRHFPGLCTPLPPPDTSAARQLSSSGARVSGGSSRKGWVFLPVTQITASFLLLYQAGALVRLLWSWKRHSRL